MPQNTAVDPALQKLPTPINLTGPVIHGEKVGRTIGFPTANLAIPTAITGSLKPGVYFGWCRVGESVQVYPCLPYYGPRLIFGETHNVFEVFIYDFEQDIYDHTLHVELSHYLRGPLAISSLAQLKQQLTQDKETGKTLITKPSTIGL